jgi:hypothetical protein
MPLFFFLLFSLLVAREASKLADDVDQAFQERAWANAMNLMVYHQGAVRWVINNGGAGFVGVVDQANVLTGTPASFQPSLNWISTSEAGRIITCTATSIANSDGMVAANLSRLSHQDPGAGMIRNGEFVSSNRSGLVAPAPATCRNGSPAYYSTVS